MTNKLKIYNAFYSYNSRYDGDIFSVSRNVWTVVGKNKEEAEKSFYNAKFDIEKEINDKSDCTREISSLDELIEIEIPRYEISIKKLNKI